MPLAPGQLEKQNSIHQHPKLHAPSTQPSSSQNSIHQRPKLHAPEHPAVKLAGQLANQQPPTRPSISQSIHQHPKLHAPKHPAVKLVKQRPPAPQTACPLAPGCQARRAAPTSTPNRMPPSTRQARKAAPTSTPNCMPPSTRQSSSQSSIHQHLKLHAPEHPAVKLAKQHPPAPQTACPPAPGRQARKAASTSTSNCMPPSTRPSISQSIHQPSTSNCMPPSTRPSISQSSIHQHLKLHAP